MSHPPTISFPNLGNYEPPKPVPPVAVQQQQQQPQQQKQQKKKQAGVRSHPSYDADHFERLNFLHQLSMLTSNVSEDLSRLYAYELKRLARKTVSRLGKPVKKTFCRKCLRFSAKYSRVRVKHIRKHSVVVVRCSKCNIVRRYPFRKK